MSTEKDFNEQEREEYKIFDYMKEHNSLLIACISAFVAALSFMINFCVYTYQCVSLQGWNVDFRLVNFSLKGQPYYYIITSLTYCVSVLVFSSKIEKTFTQYYYNSEMALKQKYIALKLKKICKLNSKELKRLKRNEKEKIAMDTEVQENFNDLATKTEFCVCEIKKIQKSVCRRRLKEIKSALLSIIVMAVPFFLLILMLNVAIEKISWYIFLMWIICYGTIVLLSYAKSKWVNKKITSKQIKKDIDAAWDDDYVEIGELLGETGDDNYEKSSHQTIKRMFSDESIRRIANVFISSIISLYIALVLVGLTESIMKREFWIYMDGDKQYVAIYLNENQYILKEAEIEEDKLIVYTSGERILYDDDIILDYKQFSKVTKKEKGANEEKDEII